MRYVHVGINVTNLEKSIEFYEKVFGVSPVKVKTDYAKFLLETPGLNFTLNVRDEVNGNQVNHFGFQVDTAEEITLHKERLEKEGFFARDEMDTTCCYAVQDKFWVTDPKPIPTAIARKIHSVKYRSRKDKRFILFSISY